MSHGGRGVGSGAGIRRGCEWASPRSLSEPRDDRVVERRGHGWKESGAGIGRECEWVSPRSFAGPRDDNGRRSVGMTWWVVERRGERGAVEPRGDGEEVERCGLGGGDLESLNAGYCW